MDTENITSPVLKELEKYKYTHGLYGSQDKVYYKDYSFRMENKEENMNKGYSDLVDGSEFIETVELTGIDKKNSFGRYIYKLYESGNDRPYLFKNLRFKNKDDLDKVTKFELQVGGQNFNSFTSCFYKAIGLFLEMDGIPLYMFKEGLLMLKYHETNIILNTNISDIVLLVDKHMIRERNTVKNISLEYTVYQMHPSYMKIQRNDDGLMSMDLYINHPLYFLIVGQKIYDIKLYINRNVFVVKQDINGIINLTNNLKLMDFATYSINAGKIDSFRLTYRCDENIENIEYCAVCAQQVRTISGMSGMAYSK